MEKRYQVPRVLAIILLLSIGLNAIVAGAAFVVFPDGRLLGLSTYILRFSPFANFLIPGVILLVVNGIFNIFVAVLTLKRNKYYSTMISFQGILLVGWLIGQIYLLQEINALQLTLMLVGVLLILIGMMNNSNQSLKL